MWLFFDQSMGYYDGRAGDWAIVCDNPDADRPTWSAPRRLWHGATLNKPTVLKSGEWMLPISLWQRNKIGPKELRSANPDLDELRMANVFVSGDQARPGARRGRRLSRTRLRRAHGRRTPRRQPVDAGPDDKGMAESVSTDQGKTWSEPRIAYPHINARFFLRRLASGKLVLVRHGAMDERTKSRSHLTAFLSDDDGKTWQGGLVLDERNGVSYPDGFQAPDGRIYISYDRERAKEREILLAVFTEQDILERKIVGPQSRLKGLISKARGNLPSCGRRRTSGSQADPASGSGRYEREQRPVGGPGCGGCEGRPHDRGL